MARTNNLTNFLTDVATAIKTKTGDSTAIPASQFDTKIANITTGHLDNTEYTEANDDLDDILEGSTLFSINNASYLFYNGARTNTLQELIGMCKNVTDTSFMFAYSIAPSVQPTSIDLSNLDTSNVTTMNSMFYNQKKLTSLDLSNFDTSSVTTMQNMFMSCNALQSINLSGLYNMSNIQYMNNMFVGCTNLSNETLNNILYMCLTAGNKISSSNKKLSVIGLTSAQATICQGLSNYTAFINAGWTTGY